MHTVHTVMAKIAKLRVHIAMCNFVKEIDFRTKVLENKEKFGEYFYFKTYAESKQQIPSISICKYCSKYFKGRK